MKKIFLLALLILIVVSSCGPQDYGELIRVTCYSAGERIYEGVGRVSGSGIFTEEESGRELRLNGDCIYEFLERE